MDWNKFPNFTEDEFRCKCGCGRADMDEDFIDTLQTIRDAMKHPLIVSSGFRCPEHNNRVSSTGLNGPHTTGKAVDISIYGVWAWALIGAALGNTLDPIYGLGVNQKGPHKSRFIHLDKVQSSPRPWVWSY